MVELVVVSPVTQSPSLSVEETTVECVVESKPISINEQVHLRPMMMVE